MDGTKTRRRHRRRRIPGQRPQAPERLVWGSDWPHPTESSTHKPNDAVLFDLIGEWVSDEAVRRSVLVDNPEILYGFAKAG